MARVAEIEGTTVRLFDRTLIGTADLNDIQHLLSRPVALRLSGLPRNPAVYLQAIPETNRLVIVCEQKPTRRTISYQGDRYKLTMPWVYFAFVLTTNDPTLQQGWAINDWRVLWSNQQVHAGTQPVWRPYLPNTYDDGRICFGSAAIGQRPSIGQFIDGTIDAFWGSGFNSDLSIYFPQSGWDDFDEWQDHSSHETSFTSWDCWTTMPAGIGTFQDVMQQMELSLRTDPVIQTGIIPEMPVPSTFRNVERWLNSIQPADRDRLRAGLATLTPGQEAPQRTVTELRP